VFGPVLGADFSTSIQLIQRMMDGTMPACPQLWFGIVDVRDVADLHLRAMLHPAASGERFLAVAGESMSLLAIATILREHMGRWGSKAPTRQLPNWLVRLLAVPLPVLRQILPDLGRLKNASNEKARHVLGWTARSNEDAILATAQSLVRLGLLKAGRR
jgi:nucleoside-diphosphate-sugar epimerase